MNPKEIINRIKEELRTTTGRNILTFCVFLLISTIFWFLMALNDEVQHDYRVPLRLDDFPKGMTIISGNVPVVNVTVKDKGSALAKFSWGNDPTLKLSYNDFNNVAENHLLVSEAQLNSALRGVFGSSASIVAVKPDSLYLHYTTNRGIPVKVIVDADISTEPQYETFGQPRLSVDSVLIYSNLKERLKIKTLLTQPISLSGLTDTTTVEVPLVVPDGMRAIPATVKVTFPIEPLVTKTRQLKIETVNLPPDLKVIPFPSVVDATYLLPKSLYNAPTTPLRVTLDYNDITPGSNTVPIHLSGMPSYYKSAHLSTDNVEYLIEKK